MLASYAEADHTVVWCAPFHHNRVNGSGRNPYEFPTAHPPAVRPLSSTSTSLVTSSYRRDFAFKPTNGACVNITKQNAANAPPKRYDNVVKSLSHRRQDDVETPPEHC